MWVLQHHPLRLLPCCCNQVNVDTVTVQVINKYAKKQDEDDDSDDRDEVADVDGSGTQPQVTGAIDDGSLPVEPPAKPSESYSDNKGKRWLVTTCGCQRR